MFTDWSMLRLTMHRKHNMNDATTQHATAAQGEKASAGVVRGVARGMLYHTL